MKNKNKTKKPLKEDKKIIEIHIYIHEIPAFQYPQQPTYPQYPNITSPGTTGPTPPYQFIC